MSGPDSHGSNRTQLLRRVGDMERCVRIRFYTIPRQLTSAPEVNLSELQKTLDTQGLEVVEHQKESVVGRKALSDRTKGECTTTSYPAVLSL